MKRIFDIFFGIFACLFFLPIGVVLAFIVKFSSKGPVFYRCSRVGLHGKPIRCWKFRTMFVDAEEKLSSILASNLEKQREWDTYQKLKDDPRVTSIGLFLRKTSLDELPQFLNVIKGDLSVVGPRPVTQEEVTKYFGPKAAKILSVRPGLTGIWQTSGRSLLTFEERVALEESYVDRYSMSLDLQIIFKTIPLLFSDRGAF